MTITHILDLYEHMHWADESVWAVILNSDECSGDTRILDTMHHLHATQRAFLDVWMGREFVFHRREDAPAADVHRFGRAFHKEAGGWLASAARNDLGETVVVPWTKYFEKQLGRSAGRVTLGESIYQVVLHSMHHRAQVATRIRELGAEPPPIDYIIWLWMDRPEPDQSVTP